jgi:hypothetical protein
MRFVGLVAALLCAPLAAAPAHEHGVARLDVGVEPRRITLRLDIPLDSLLGFERAPRTDAERQAAAAAVARLRDAATLFRIDAKAGCKPGTVELVSAPLGLGPGARPAEPVPAAARNDHADLEGQFDFDCIAGGQAGFLEIGLFEAFPRLQRIETQIVTPRGQLKATLRRPNARVQLAR